ncbi:hypothetical protein D3C80_1347810 [compost metagenome]
MIGTMDPNEFNWIARNNPRAFLKNNLHFQPKKSIPQKHALKQKVIFTPAENKLQYLYLHRWGPE